MQSILSINCLSGGVGESRDVQGAISADRIFLRALRFCRSANYFSSKSFFILSITSGGCTMISFAIASSSAPLEISKSHRLF